MYECPSRRTIINIALQKNKQNLSDIVVVFKVLDKLKFHRQCYSFRLIKLLSLFFKYFFLVI